MYVRVPAGTVASIPTHWERQVYIHVPLVQVLHVPCCSVSALDGFNCMPFLEELYAAFNQVTVLEPLMDAEQLAVLDLEANLVQDLDQVDFLNACERLTWVSLLHNPVCPLLSAESFPTSLLVEAMDDRATALDAREILAVANEVTTYDGSTPPLAHRQCMGSACTDLHAEGSYVATRIAELAVDAALWGLGFPSAPLQQEFQLRSTAAQYERAESLTHKTASKGSNKQAQPCMQRSTHDCDMGPSCTSGFTCCDTASDPNWLQLSSATHTAAVAYRAFEEPRKLQGRCTDAELLLVLKALRARARCVQKSAEAGQYSYR